MLAALTLPVWLPLAAAIAIALRTLWPYVAVIWIFWWACG
jgi:hypothetical protein